MKNIHLQNIYIYICTYKVENVNALCVLVRTFS